MTPPILQVYRDEPCTTALVPHDPASARVVRRRMVVDLEAEEFPSDLIDDAELVLGELLANALDHGQPNREGNIEVTWCTYRRHIRLSVLDGGLAPHLTPVQVDRFAERGRGLAIIDALCDNWNQSQEGGTRVSAEIWIKTPDDQVAFGHGQHGSD